MRVVVDSVLILFLIQAGNLHHHRLVNLLHRLDIRFVDFLARFAVLFHPVDPILPDRC